MNANIRFTEPNVDCLKINGIIITSFYIYIRNTNIYTKFEITVVKFKTVQKKKLPDSNGVRTRASRSYANTLTN